MATTEATYANAHFARLWDYCKERGWNPPELHRNKSSQKGPRHLDESEQVHGLILYVKGDGKDHGYTIPVDKTIEAAAELMCDRLGIPVPRQ